MDVPAQSKPTILYTKRVFNLTPRLVPLLVLVAGIIIGYGASYILTQKKVIPQDANPQIPKYKQISEDELPIALYLLKNKIVTQWRGYIEGTLIAKDEQAITIKDDKGNSLIIPNRVNPEDKMNTLFFDPDVYKTSKKGYVTLDDIPLQSQLRGDFFVIPGLKNRIVGGSFTVVKKGAPAK